VSFGAPFFVARHPDKLYYRYNTVGVFSMRLIFLATIILTALPGLNGCGYSVSDAAEDISQSSDGLAGGTPISNEWVNAGKFTQLAARGPDNVVFTIGEKFQIRADGDADVLEKLRFKLDGDSLIIGRSDKKWYNAGAAPAATIFVTAPALTGASLAGSGNLKADKLSGDEVAISTAGSGNIEVTQIEAKALVAETAGSGSIKAAGTAENADFSIAGKGSVDAAKLTAADAKISIAGSGNASINASATVDASIAGSGDVNVTGGAKCTKSVAGSGKVNCG
jgi:Putative auto-transporter adhesin, head GIN domain